MLFVVLFFAFGKVLLGGAHKEEKKKRILPQRKRSEVRWSNNPMVDRQGVVELTTIVKGTGLQTNATTEEAASEPTHLEDGADEVHEESVAWSKHFDPASENSFYECIVSCVSWGKPAGLTDAAEVCTRQNALGEVYYSFKTRRTTWDLPAGVDEASVHDASAPPPVERIDHVVPQSNCASIEYGGSAGCLLAEARQRLKDAADRNTVLPPADINVRGELWEVIDESGNTCYLNIKNNKVSYTLPKGWVRSLAKHRFGNSGTYE
jgi:hypothetical protein